MINSILTGDSADILKKIESNIIDLTISSPPYDTMRSYKGKIKDDIKYNGYSFPFYEIANELFRVTKDGGVVVWIVNDQVINGGESGTSFKMALYFQSIGFKIYDTMIYHKNGAAYQEASRYAQVFEYMFVFLKGKRPNTVNIIKDRKNKWAGSTNFGTPSKRLKNGKLIQGDKFIVADYGSRYNVWYINNGNGFGSKDNLSHLHPASYPDALAEDHILSWSKEEDIVLDPMVGSGTTALMAKLNNRNYIGIDINQEYVDLSNDRLKSVIPYTKENPNPKIQYILTREKNLENRKNKKANVGNKLNI